MSDQILGKGGNSRSANNYSPPNWAKPMYQKTLDELRKLYDGTSYKNREVSDLSENTRDAIKGLGDTARQFNNSYLNDLLNNQTSSGQNLRDIAQGKNIGNNPVFDKALSDGMNSAADIINRQMSGAGRYGSGANNLLLANKMSSMANQAKAQQYNQDIANMMKANSLIDSSNMQRFNNGLNFLNSKDNAYSRWLNGGQLIDKNNQDKLNADKQNWQDEQNMKWNRLKMFEQILNGAAGKYRQNTSNDPGSSFFSSVFKGLIGK